MAKKKALTGLFLALVLVVSCAPKPEFQPIFKGIVFAGSIPVAGQKPAPQTQLFPTPITQPVNQSQIQLSWPTNARRFGVAFGQYSDYQPQGHTGIDFDVAEGSPIYSAGEGTVVYTGWFPQSWTSQGHGNTVWIYHGLAQNGKPLFSVYAHLSQFLVKPGDRVQKGQQIALSGNTGAGSGPHLHFAIRLGGGFQYEGTDSNGRNWADGQWVNPDNWIS